MPALSTIAAVVSIAAGANSIYQSTRSKGSSNNNNIQQVADPFAELRPYFQSILTDKFPKLTSLDPKDIENDPSFQFEREQGLHAIDAAASSSGLLRSGTRPMEAARFAEGLAATYDQKRFDRQMSVLQAIMAMSGVNIGNPGAAAQGILGQQQLASNQMNNGINALNGGLGMLRQWWSTPDGGATPISQLPTGLDIAGGPAYG